MSCSPVKHVNITHANLKPSLPACEMCVQMGRKGVLGTEEKGSTAVL